MTRKDYVETANILNAELDENNFILINKLAVSFAEMFESDNPRFDFQRFIDAVNKEGN